MMVKAMEVSGIEGNFRNTAENVMRVLRINKESVTAMLEAFVHDPLINWRLLNTTDAATGAAMTTAIDPSTNVARADADKGNVLSSLILVECYHEVYCDIQM
jgi:FKBP12-rapamycin complex-associated protein